MESFLFLCHTLPFCSGNGRAPNFITTFFCFICCSHYCSSIKAKAIFFVVLFFHYFILLLHPRIQLLGEGGKGGDFLPINLFFFSVWFCLTDSIKMCAVFIFRQFKFCTRSKCFTIIWIVEQWKHYETSHFYRLIL